MRPRTPCALALSLTTALAVLCVLATPALAARGHEFAGAFGWGVSSGASELQRCGATPVPESEPLSNCLPGSKGSGEGQFDTPNAIAVNESTGDVYVLDAGNDRVEIFNAQGTKFEGEFNGSGTLKNEEGKAAGGGGGAEEVPSGKFDEPNAIAIDNAPSSPSFGDVYVADTRGHKGGTFEEARMVIDKFDLTGKYIGQITRNPNGEAFSNEGFSELFGVAVDSSGQVWVEEQNFGSSPEGAAHYTSEEHNEWINFLSTESSNARHPGPGLAVDSEDDLYVHNLSFLDRLSKYKSAVAGTTAELIAGEVDEEAPTGVAVEGGSDDVYIAHAQNVHRVGPAGASLERLKAPGVPSFSAVAVNASSSILTVYVADAANNRIDLFTPEAPSTPKVLEGSEGVANVTATSADFSAEVNPRSEASEAPTSYSFKYGPCGTPSTCSSSPYTQSIPVPEGSLAPNYEPDPVSAHPQDLSPHTTYHMRLEAHNSHGAAKPGEELVFSTQTPGPPSSPDNRRYELVSPPDKHGASISARGQSGAGLIQAAAGGGAISYSANAPTEASPAGFSQTVEVLSRRSPASWASQDIATPHEALVGFNNGSNGEYPFFTEDLSSAVVGPNGPFTKALSSQASERTLYLRSNFPPGDSSHPCGSSCYRPLVVGCPGGGEPCPAAVQEAANVPEGTKFGEEGTCEENCGPFFLGASPDASHVLLSAHAKLTEDAPAEELGGSSLYEWSAGQLALVSVLPSGQAVAPSALPALGFLGEGSGGRIARHAISSDGQRVVFSAGELDCF
jgi:DNA-binding beta-propeller fold protein YncE